MNPIQYFGAAWNDEIRKLEERPAPLGDECQWCASPILLGERGLFIPVISPAGRPAHRPEHVECFLRQTLGSIDHQEGRCCCCGQGGTDVARVPRGVSRRSEALDAYRNWIRKTKTERQRETTHDQP